MVNSAVSGNRITASGNRITALWKNMQPRHGLWALAALSTLAPTASALHWFLLARAGLQYIEKITDMVPARSHFWGQVLTPKFGPQITFFGAVAEPTFLQNYYTNSYDSKLHSRRSTSSGKFGKRLRSICLVVYIIGQNLPKRSSSLTADFFWGIVCTRALAS